MRRSCSATWSMSNCPRSAARARPEGAPDRINSDPYGDGWMYKVALEDPDETGDLMDADAYAESIDEDD